MIVRPIENRDRIQLASLLGRTPEFNEDEVAVALELIDDSLAKGAESDYACLVAAEGVNGAERIAGYCCYGPTPMTEHTFDFYWVAVDRELRGRGIGELLFGSMLKALRARGGRIIRIETSSTSAYEGTLRFHHKIGFVEGGRIPDFYRDGDDLIILYRIVTAVGAP